MTGTTASPTSSDGPVDGGAHSQIVEELPEIDLIANPDLRAKVIAAWELALEKSSFTSVRQIAPAGNPGVLELRHGDQTDHIRGVTRLALAMTEVFEQAFPEIGIDRDIVIAGGLCHDIGKPWEFDPENQKRWKESPRAAGRPSIRHPAYGAHICLTVGLPEEIAHIATAHSGEGELLVRSLENTIINFADHAFWEVLVSGGLVIPETIPAKGRK